MTRAPREVAYVSVGHQAPPEPSPTDQYAQTPLRTAEAIPHAYDPA